MRPPVPDCVASDDAGPNCASRRLIQSPAGRLIARDVSWTLQFPPRLSSAQRSAFHCSRMYLTCIVCIYTPSFQLHNLSALPIKVSADCYTSICWQSLSKNVTICGNKCDFRGVVHAVPHFFSREETRSTLFYWNLSWKEGKENKKLIIVFNVL